MEVFDYIFFRVTKFYEKWEDDVAYVFGIGFVSILQLCILLLLMLILAFSFHPINELLFERHQGKNFLSNPLSLIGLPVILANLFRYTRVTSFDILRNKWKDETHLTATRRRRIMAAFSIVLFSITFGLAIYRKYYFNP